MGEEPQTVVAAFDFVAFIMQISPQLMTAGGVFATYIAFGKWIKNWIIKGLLTMDELKTYLFNKEEGVLTLLKQEWEGRFALIKQEHENSRRKLKIHYDKELEELKEDYEKQIKDAKEHAANELSNHKERSDEKDEADKKWLNELQQKVEKLQIKVGE